MKSLKYLLIAISIFALVEVNAQDRSKSFFDNNGAIATETIDAFGDTIAKTFHRMDDIVWTKVLYKVIDLRDKQNQQLFFPIRPAGAYKNFFRVVMDAMLEGNLRAFGHRDFDISPDFTYLIPKDSLSSIFVDCVWNPDDNTPINTSLIYYDELTNSGSYDNFIYADYIRKQNKFIIQEVVFFDKHYSRLYSKIVAVAPLYFHNETNVTSANMGVFNSSGESYWNALIASVTCWVLYDELRPYMAKQYIIPKGNETQRTTYDDFFTSKMYFSYLLGDSNMQSRMLLQTYTSPDRIRKEQRRIETELLNFEQDLWEY
ncbi:MAG: gliding motility protein GldN [Paludibacter sp.]|jgi:gliding motility associated protien GldN|nr:gliding motility protein GldN [Paludibacter sp.]